MVKTLKIFSRTKNPITSKLGNQHRGFKRYKNYINEDPELTLTYFTARLNFVAYALKVYNVSINDDHGLTLTYFTARSNFVKIAYCAEISPRCQVSIYRTIGPLVKVYTIPRSMYRKVL